MSTQTQDGVIVRCRECGTDHLLHRDHAQPDAVCNGRDDTDTCGARLFPGAVVTTVSLEAALQLSLDRD